MIRLRELLSFLILALSWLTVPAPVVAADSGSGTSSVVAPDRMQGNLLFGQDHAYTVHLRGNGEAIVTARLTVGNQTSKPLTSLSFKVPETELTDLVGYQQTVIQSAAYEKQFNSDYYQYAKLSFSQVDGQYRVTLPKAIAAGDQAVVLLGYASRQYISHNWLVSNYQFQSLVVSERIRSLTVAINVDSQLYLKQVDSGVNYQGTGVAVDTPLAATEDVSRSLDPIISSVGYGQRVVTASNLAAGESYSVSGSFADARWKFYVGWLAGALLLLLVLPVLLWWGLRLLAQRTSISSLMLLAATAAVALANIAAVSGIVMGADWLITQNNSMGGSSFLLLLVGLLTLVLVLVLVLGPALWLWLSRHRGQAALLLGGWQIVWLVVLMVVYIVMFTPQTTSGGIEPMLSL